MKKFIIPVLLWISVLGIGIAAGITTKQTREAVVGTAPMAPGVKNPGIANRKHWRLVMEGEYNGQPVKRKPVNAIRYNSADACAIDGTKLPPPPARIEEQNINFLIRCLPYRTGDTDTETPIGGEVTE